MAFRLILQDREYSPSEILKSAAAEVEALAPFEQSALAFVRAWLEGRQTFTIHTSGSTGEPKAIQISRQHMQASARLTLQALEILPADAALLCINPDYIGGKMMLVRALEGGLPLWVREPEANPVRKLPVPIQLSFVALVPLQLQAMLADRKVLEVLNSMKAVIVGGAAVSAALEVQAQVIEAAVYSTYGMTETVSHIALRRINGGERQDYFTALPGVVLSTDERNCLVIEGPIAEGPVVTNDVVELLGQGRFRLIGRADNIINSGGVKVQAERLERSAEACLHTLGYSRRLLAGALPDERLGQKVVLLIEGSSLSVEVKNALGLCLEKELPDYWVPKEILFLEEFVESSNGKIKRKETWAKL